MTGTRAARLQPGCRCGRLEEDEPPDYSQRGYGVRLLGARVSLLLHARSEVERFRYVTNEFEVTKERLGCYLPIEHIDNPKGYAEGEDARQYDPRLRPPVDPRELEIDPR